MPQRGERHCRSSATRVIKELLEALLENHVTEWQSTVRF